MPCKETICGVDSLSVSIRGNGFAWHIKSAAATLAVLKSVFSAATNAKKLFAFGTQTEKQALSYRNASVF